MILTINVAVLLGVIIVLRLRRPTHARSRFDEKLSVAIVLVFGVLIAPTDFGGWILNALAQGVSGLENIRF